MNKRDATFPVYRAVRDGRAIGGWLDGVGPWLGAPKFLLTNIAEQAVEMQRYDEPPLCHIDSSTLIPNKVRPPFDKMWSEMRVPLPRSPDNDPNEVLTETGYLAVGTQLCVKGSSILGQVADKVLQLPGAAQSKINELRDYSEDLDEVCGFVYRMFPASGPAWSRPVFQGMFVTPIDPEGRPAWVDDGFLGWMKIAHGSGDPAESMHLDGLDSIVDLAVFVLLHSFALLHCRNVRATEKQYRPSPAVKRLLRLGHQPIKYHIVDVDLPNKQVAKNGSSNGGPSHTPLHLVRGHYAHYTEEAPLFGKYVCTVWRPQHVRGTRSAGVSLHDYRGRV